MRKLWIGTLLVPFVLALTATKAAVEPAQRELQLLSAEAEYVGALLADSALEQRIARQRAEATGVIDFYNVWTSFQKVKLKSNLTITGHSYQICQNVNRSVFFGNLIFAGSGPLTVRLQITLNRGGGSFVSDFNIPSLGFWMITGEVPSSAIPPGYYKITAKYTVISGGSGSGKETAWFDIFSSC